MTVTETLENLDISNYIFDSYKTFLEVFADTMTDYYGANTYKYTVIKTPENAFLAGQITMIAEYINTFCDNRFYIDDQDGFRLAKDVDHLFRCIPNNQEILDDLLTNTLETCKVSTTR